MWKQEVETYAVANGNLFIIVFENVFFFHFTGNVALIVDTV